MFKSIKNVQKYWEGGREAKHMLEVKTTFLVDGFSKKIVSWIVLPWTRLKMVLMFILILYLV